MKSPSYSTIDPSISQDSSQLSTTSTTAFSTQGTSMAILLPQAIRGTLRAAVDGSLSATRTGQVGSVAANPVNPGAPSTVETSSMPAKFTAVTTYSRPFSLNTAVTTVLDQSAATQTSIANSSEPVTSSIPIPPSEATSKLVGTTSQTTGVMSSQTAFVTPSASSIILNSTFPLSKTAGTSSILASFTDATPPSLSTSATTAISTPSSSSSVTPTVSTSIGSLQASNIAVALGFNTIFTTLTTESPCNFTGINRVSACVNGQLAQCAENGKYNLSPCPQGQQCFALPLTGKLFGVAVRCDTASDAYSELGLAPLPVTSDAGATLSHSQSTFSSSTTENIITPTISNAGLVSTLTGVSQPITISESLLSASKSAPEPTITALLSSTQQSQQPTSPTNTIIFSGSSSSQTTAATNPMAISSTRNTISSQEISAQTNSPVPITTQVNLTPSTTNEPSQISSPSAQSSSSLTLGSTIPPPIQTSVTTTTLAGPGFTIVPVNASGAFTVTVTVTATVTDRF